MKVIQKTKTSFQIWEQPFCWAFRAIPMRQKFLGQKRVVATAKHFVGDGGTQYGIDKGDTIGRMGDIKKIHAHPYHAAIENDVQTVMASFSSVNGEKMHGSKSLLNRVLRAKWVSTALLLAIGMGMQKSRVHRNGLSRCSCWLVSICIWRPIAGKGFTPPCWLRLRTAQCPWLGSTRR